MDATETKTSVFATLQCPRCGEEGFLSLDLDDLDTCRCRSCDEETTVSNMVQQATLWARLAAWVDRAKE